MSTYPDRYVGIDQSYTGLAIVAISTETSEAPTINLTGFESKQHGTGIDRLTTIYHHVIGCLTEIDDIAHVCMEGYSNASKFGREQAGELGAIVKLAVYDYFDRFAYHHELHRYPTIVKPSSLKKYVTGNGAAKKNNMLLAVYKKWGFETTDDNVADAYSLARVAMALDGFGGELAYEKEVLKSVHPHTEMPAATVPNS